MKNKLLFTAAVAAFLFGCANSDDYGTPDLSGMCTEIPVTKQVSDITSAATSTLQRYTEDDVIEAIVTSNDQAGNFYKSISFVNTANTIGFSIPVNAYNLGNEFRPGQKVYIHMKDRTFVKQYGSTVIGSYYNNATPDMLTDDGVGRVSLVTYKDIIKRSCDPINEEAIVKHMTITEAKNDANLNMLIELDAVQFSDASLGKKFYDTSLDSPGGSTNHSVTDISGANVVLRGSQYANFANTLIPSGSGKIRGVMTKYQSTYQFMIRSIDDVMLDQPRFDAAPPIVGTPVTFGLYNQNFESFAVGNRNFPNAINDAFVGSRYWEVKTFSGNKYIEMTSFSGSGNPGVDAKTLFFIPVNFTTANNFTFKKEFRFMAGAALKVYYVTEANYTAGGTVNMANFVDITSGFNNLTYPANGASQNSFTTAGTYAIPASLTGNGFFVLEYTGTSSVTTTVQIDDIVVN